MTSSPMLSSRPRYPERVRARLSALSPEPVAPRKQPSHLTVSLTAPDTIRLSGQAFADVNGPTARAFFARVFGSSSVREAAIDSEAKTVEVVFESPLQAKDE